MVSTEFQDTQGRGFSETSASACSAKGIQKGQGLRVSSQQRKKAALSGSAQSACPNHKKRAEAETSLQMPLLQI